MRAPWALGGLLLCGCSLLVGDLDLPEPPGELGADAAPSDLAPPEGLLPDLALPEEPPPDLALPEDLATPADLAPDLSPPADLAGK